MTVLLTSCNTIPAHTVEISGGPSSVVEALATSLVHVAGYVRMEHTGLPTVHLIVDAMDQDADDVVLTYLRNALVAKPRPIPLFLTARPKRFQRRGLDWENEFLFSSGRLRIDQLTARIRMLAHMWGDQFPVDVIRDSVVGSFRMMMQLDETDYHHRSQLVEDLQRFAEWDGTGTAPLIRAAPDNAWDPPLQADHPYTALFHSAYQQIMQDMQLMLMMRKTYNTADLFQARDRANTILRKIPTVTGRFVHVLRNARPHVLIVDDQATEIAEILRSHRVGYEADSASLADIFEFVAEPLSLKGDPPYPPYFDAEGWIRQRVSGAIHPGNSLHDLRCADLILLDLSLHQGQESELAGFIILEKLRNAIPDLPLVIHTGSAALGHIIQAIRNGADWYIRKDGARPYSDLASILNDIGRRPEWTKRAKRLQRERKICNEADLPEILRRDEYLYIWRSLGNDISEGELLVSPFTAGVSGAVTCGIHVFAPNGGKKDDTAPPIASFVAKIDRPYVMLSERERFRRLVRPRIGNRAGRIDSEVVYAGPNVAGIAYTFSGIHQGQKGTSRTSLLPLSKFLERTLDDPNATFMQVAPVFDELLNDLLQTLHRSAPPGERGEWMEPLFGEALTLRDSHEMRLPPLIDIELTGFGDPTAHENSGSLDATVGSDVHLAICRVHKTAEDGFIVTFRDGGTGLAHHANLTGEIARFLSCFRNLRPNRPFSVSGRVVRTRSVFYDTVSATLARDLEWLSANGRPNPFDAVPQVLQVFDSIERETLGIIHGDLNLNNILLDVDGNDSAVHGALWLIDFARTRRDSLAHDFVELEVDLVTRTLAAISGVAGTDRMTAFMESLDAGALFDRQRFDNTTVFVSEACQFIRRAATAAGIQKREYLASLMMYYLLVIKLYQPHCDERDEDAALQIRRWSVAGASAALYALNAELELRPIAHTPRIPVKRRLVEPKKGGIDRTRTVPARRST